MVKVNEWAHKVMVMILVMRDERSNDGVSGDEKNMSCNVAGDIQMCVESYDEKKK